MYLEILHDVVGEILKDERLSKLPIVIQLTPTIYDAFSLELNKYYSFNGETPIEGFRVESIILYSRTITIKQGTELDNRFEKKIVKELAKISNLIKNGT